MNIAKTIKQLSQTIQEEMQHTFQHLHAHPELSFEEFETSQFIQDKLSAWGIPFQAGYVKTGIVGKIEGKNPSKRTIALRSDMDALPIFEQSGVACASKNQGVMHACGHDAHMTALLGASYLLHALKDQFEGTVLLVFQPGEEMHPGGARLMLAAGALNNPKPDLILGQHVLPGMLVGHVGYCSGRYMASADEIYITVKGRGGHAAMPHLLNDSVLAAARILVALQDVVSRLAPATIPTVLSFGKIVADGATNVIPEQVLLAGTLRTMDETWRAEAKQHIRNIATQVAASLGCTCEFDIKDGYPSVINSDDITNKALAFSQEFLGTDQVEWMNQRMTAEDFGFYSSAFPSTFFRFGISNDATQDAGGLHTPNFRIAPEALDTAMTNLAYLAISFLNE